ncbi:MAG: HAD-IA family hydrolase [Pseudomonadales bacterium]|nr:HAD-IA family hydrolase [Pseudomonadales bacterium]
MTLYIFDWDGTLIDSAEKIIASMQGAALELGLTAPGDDEVRHIIGLGLPEAILYLFPDLHLSERTRLQQLYSRHFVEAESMVSAAFPGVQETLQTLLQQGHQLAVATGKSRRGLERAFKDSGLARFFCSSRCADETKSKPHPLMLQQLLDECRVPFDQAVMIGDTSYDMEMASRLSMPRVAVSYGAHSKDKLLAYSPDMIIDDFSQVLAWQEV